ncbi:glutamate-rich protein 1 isoform 2-T2 [Discoglossus pictus]
MERATLIVSKVLKKLYSEDAPSTANLHQQTEEKTTPHERVDEVKEINLAAECLTDAKKESRSNQKLYTVSLPPEDCIPKSQNDGQSSSTEDSSSNEDVEKDQLSHRRRRKKKKCVNPALHTENPDNVPHKQNSQTSDGGSINKNKRRKLKRKRQKERMKAAGLLPKACAVDFYYEPDEVNPDMDSKTTEKPSEEDSRRKLDDLLDFIQATQEIYFSDSKNKSPDSAVSFNIVFETLNQIKNAEISSSDVSLLHHLKTLLLLQDIERLKAALDDFKEQSSLPSD